jgi:hypothetical protein
MSCNALVVKENFGSDLPVAGSLPLTETGLPPKVTVAPDFFAVFLADFFGLFFTDFFFVTFFFAIFFFAVFFFVAMIISLIFVIS